jgi:hypothetical protein
MACGQPPVAFSAVSRERPINADVPAPESEPSRSEPVTAGAEPGPQVEPAPEPQGKARRQPVPLAPKLIAATVAVALAFILVAVIGGSGGSESDSTPDGPAPVAAPAEPGESESSSSADAAGELGYPAFATNNTTRVGGSDPAATAAAVALAVFPSTTPALRPAAVTLVAENNWPGALAASVLVAEPVRAPVLIAAADSLPHASAEALAVLDPQGDRWTAGAEVFAIGEADVGEEAGKVTRVPAGDAAATAAAIARLRDRLFGSAPKHLVVASSASPELAMPAAAWAARSGDPILFADRDELPQATAAILRRHSKLPIYVLGPPAAISSTVVRAIAKIDKRVKRVSGEDAVANALALARYADRDFGWNVNDPGHGFVLARSDSTLSAAAAAPLSASGTWGPLLLTDSAATLPAPLRDYFLDVKPGYTTDPTRAFYNHVWVVGDQEAIDVNQQAEVNALAELAKIDSEP